MIDNFEVQPYPLEASADGETWALVIGWRQDLNGDVVPLAVLETGLQPLADTMEKPLRYRLADTRPNAGRAAPAVASTGTPARRERSPHTESGS